MTDTQDKPNRPYPAHRLRNTGALDQPCERHATRGPVMLPRHFDRQPPRDCEEDTMNPLDATAKSPVPEKQRKTDDARLRPTIAAHDSPLIDEKRLCADLGISSVTATKWRAKAAGPPFIKVGRLVRYRRADVEAWLASRTIGRKSA